MPKELPPLEELDKIISYDPITGLFMRLNNGKIIGKPVRFEDDIYIHIQIAGQQYMAHRLAWHLHYRRPPRNGYEIDHINGKKGDNRIENLRELNRAQNCKSKYNLHFFIDGKEWI